MKKSSKIAIGVASGAVVLIGGAYLAGYFVAGSQVPPKATVNGVAIGGLSPAAANEKLVSELGPGYAAAISVTAGDKSVSIDPVVAGMVPDFEATVRSAGGGFSWNPLSIINGLTGGSDVRVITLVDEAKLEAALNAQASAFAAAGVNATVAFEGVKVQVSPAVDAQELDVAETAPAVTDAFEENQTSAEAVLKTTAPAVTDEDAAKLVSEFADPLVSGPVEFTLGSATWTITPEQLAASAKIETTEAGVLAGSIDTTALLAATTDEQKALKLTPAKDASFTWSNGGVSVVPSVVGQSLDEAKFGESIGKIALAAQGARTAALEVTVKEPEFTTEEATALGTFSKIGSFTTQYPHAAYRNQNLGRAAGLVNGSVLMPDEIFSLNDTLGERTEANGFTDGYVINGGRLVKESGGGISQSATTLFNAAFFAGYKDIEHKPHSLYFDRYPAGREATIYYGSLDLRFQNDTKYPGYIRGYITPSSSGQKGSITFEIWSIPTWDKVTSTELVKSNFYSGTTRVVTGDPKCEPQAPIQGFTVNWERLFHRDGVVVKREPFSWKYSAGDRIVCEP